MTIFKVEDSRPFITSDGLPVQWHTGSAAWWWLTSGMVRVNRRGIAYRPRGWKERRDLSSLPEWTSEPCEHSAHALCATRTSLVFPSRQTPVVSETLDWRCDSTATNRLITNDTARYDVSACDVLDARADYVLVGETLFVCPSTELPTWVYWTVCVLIVYLVRCLSKYVLASVVDGLDKDNGAPKETTAQDRITPKGPRSDPAKGAPKADPSKGDYPNPVICITACSATLLLVSWQGDFVFVTEEALLFYRFTLLYNASYTALFAGNRLYALYLRLPERADPPFYNLLAGVLLLVASRLYCGPETPYNPPLIFILAVRMAVKSRRGSDPLRSFTLLLDAFMTSLTCLLGFSPDSRYLIALFACAMAASDALVAD